MKKQVIVLGAGIIGASIAYQLQKAGAQVTVLGAGRESATQASFGWINASFYLNDDHFRLRADAIAAYRVLSSELDISVNWCGCLCFDVSGDAFDAQVADLKVKGYEFNIIDKDQFQTLAPDVGQPPDRCLYFPQEAAAESDQVAAEMLNAAIKLGARVFRGVAATGFIETGDAVTGVTTPVGDFRADHVVSAVGTATQRLMKGAGVHIRMLQRPAVMLRTQPIAQKFQHILVSEIGELRQLPDGALLLPAAIGHQSDDAETVPDITAATDDAFARLQAFLPSVDLKLQSATLAYRPVPADDLPVMGEAKDGLYVACMHSGITLAALAGQLVSQEVLDGPTNATAKTLAPYRPDRFTN